MDPLILVISFTIFIAVVSLVSALAPKKNERDTMASRLEVIREEGAARPAKMEPISRLKSRSYSGLPILSAFLAQFKGSEAVALHLERAGVPLRVGEFYMIRWAMAAAMAMAPFVFTRTPLTFLMAAGAAVLGYLLPAMWVNGKKKKRTNRINAQLVDMLGMLANSLKSGYGLMQSFEFAAKQMPPPLSTELSRMLREANLGMGAEEALMALGERVNSADLDMVLTAINIQRAVGGNLSEVLEQVAYTMRERERIRGEVSTLTAQQRMTGVVIGGLPIFMFGVFMLMNPDYMSLLFTETAGRIMLGLAIGLETVGYFSMKKIMAIEV